MTEPLPGRWLVQTCYQWEKPMSREKQRWLGLLSIVFGVLLTMWMWHDAVTEGSFLKLTAIGPMLVVFGFGPLLFPFDPTRMRSEWGIEYPTTLAQYPAPWKITFGVGLVVGFLNYLVVAA